MSSRLQASGYSEKSLIQENESLKTTIEKQRQTIQKLTEQNSKTAAELKKANQRLECRRCPEHF